MKEKRLDWIDAVRGVAISLVVFAHCDIPMQLKIFIYSFHIPLFFILSGFLLNSKLNKPFSIFFKHKFFSLLIPYFFFASLLFLYWFLIRQLGLDPIAARVNPIQPLNGILIALRGGNFMILDSQLWFICSLFCAEIMFYIMYHRVKGDRVLLGLSILLLTIIGCIYYTFFGYKLSWSIDTVPFTVVFIWFGFVLKDNYSLLKSKFRHRRYLKPLVFSITLILFIAIGMLNGKVDMAGMKYGSYILYFVAACTGSLFIIMTFESMNIHSKFLSYIGKSSLIIYALHPIFLFGIIGLLMTSFFGKSQLFSVTTSLGKIGNSLLYTVLAIVACIPIIWFLNKFIPFCIGRVKSSKHR